MDPYDEYDYDQDCGMTPEGACVLAGSEFCDFKCRERDWFEAMSDEEWGALMDEKRNYEVEWKIKPARGKRLLSGLDVVFAADAGEAVRQAVQQVCQRNGFYPSEVVILSVVEAQWDDE